MRELLPVPMQSAMGGDVYSGIARASGTLWCGRERAGSGTSDTVLVFCHPSSNFVGHYALDPTAALGVDAVGVVTRYAGNDTQVILENCIEDLGSIITHLRCTEGYKRIVLVGNSGGGGLAALYQSQAESPTITDAPGGGGSDLTRAELPPVDALVMLNAHAGRADLLQGWLDPSIVDENDPFTRAGDLDLFADRQVPLDPEWVEAYRAGQSARMNRITGWVKGQLAELTDRYADAVPDLPFRVHGTCADPRFVDVTLDPSDREPGTLWGDAQSANLRPVTLGSFSTLRSWLSQWSVEDTHGYGPDCLQHVTVPVFVAYGTADRGCFPSMATALYEGVTHSDKKLLAVHGAGHYFDGRPDLVVKTLDSIIAWLD
ncbi:alpha/beta fold hydrolase [Williamsia soli]|uniref:alpha/beta fold hydrolase n=1 Tax=Williamsia soli TaxID=364929 RepID=UPI001A9F41F5|nr:alpha/beta fold hydrolase [Williamsia soli]